MTSQVLAIFYLNDMDHFIKEKLKIAYYVRYQDDFLLFSESKEYLGVCLEKIKKFFRTIAIMLLLAILIVIGVRFFFMSVTHGIKEDIISIVIIAIWVIIWELILK